MMEGGDAGRPACGQITSQTGQSSVAPSALRAMVPTGSKRFTHQTIPVGHECEDVESLPVIRATGKRMVD